MAARMSSGFFDVFACLDVVLCRERWKRIQVAWSMTTLPFASPAVVSPGSAAAPPSSSGCSVFSFATAFSFSFAFAFALPLALGLAAPANLSCFFALAFGLGFGLALPAALPALRFQAIDLLSTLSHSC